MNSARFMFVPGTISPPDCGACAPGGNGAAAFCDTTPTAAAVGGAVGCAGASVDRAGGDGYASAPGVG